MEIMAQTDSMFIKIFHFFNFWVIVFTGNYTFYIP